MFPSRKPLTKRAGPGSGSGSVSINQCTDPRTRIRIRLKMSRIREHWFESHWYLIISGEADPARGVEMLPHGRIEPVLVHKLSLRREELHPVVPMRE